MRRRIGVGATIAALVVVAGIGWSALALAQDRVVITTSKGSVTGAGNTWTRTITDVEPNGPNGGAIQTTYIVNVPYLNGTTAQQLMQDYKTQAALVLPAPANNPLGFGAVTDNRVDPTVRVGRQTGGYTFGDANFPSGVTMTNYVPSNSEHAPLASPAGLAVMATSLSALAWWARRRRLRLKTPDGCVAGYPHAKRVGAAPRSNVA